MISIFKNINLTIYFPYLFYYPLFYNPLTIINAYYKEIILVYITYIINKNNIRC